jgi:hypothetical protein
MFGEVGAVTTKEMIQAKLSNQGTTCRFVRYTERASLKRCVQDARFEYKLND